MMLLHGGNILPELILYFVILPIAAMVIVVVALAWIGDWLWRKWHQKKGGE
jgi:ABC-type dipeptide/oligopeptide/nickel transport system permease subunit